MKCPNCGAALETRPCGGCGWPQSTHPGEAELQQAARRRERHEEDAASEGGGCARWCSGLVAFGASLGMLGAYRLGEAAKWTSDGPAMLFVYIALGGCGLVAFCAGLSALSTFLPAPLRRFLDDLI